MSDESIPSINQEEVSFSQYPENVGAECRPFAPATPPESKARIGNQCYAWEESSRRSDFLPSGYLQGLGLLRQ